MIGETINQWIVKKFKYHLRIKETEGRMIYLLNLSLNLNLRSKRV